MDDYQDKKAVSPTERTEERAADPVLTARLELAALAAKISRRKGSALLVELLPWIDNAQDAGIKHIDIFNVLKEQGIIDKFDTYKVTLHRVRNRVRSRTVSPTSVDTTNRVPLAEAQAIPLPMEEKKKSVPEPAVAEAQAIPLPKEEEKKSVPETTSETEQTKSRVESDVKGQPETFNWQELQKVKIKW